MLSTNMILAKLGRFWRDMKSMSPVVAVIILVAVTVAVSIAIATWMGALAFTFMKTEELIIEDVDFVTGDELGNSLTIYVRNRGTTTVTVTDAKVGSSIIEIDDETIEPGEREGIQNVRFPWVTGNIYHISVITQTGNIYTHIAIASPTEGVD